MSLPSGYVELEYIESSGTQHIDTELKATTGMKTDIVFTPLNTASAIFGSQWDGAGFFLANWSTGLLWHSKGTGITVGTASTTEKNIVRCTKDTCILNSIPATVDATGTNATAYNIYLFWVGSQENSAYKGVMRLYSCQFYDNGLLVRDFAPAKTVEGEIGLYDKVFGEFYRNEGTGTFTAGPEVEGQDYIELDYVESTGTQYIDTGFTPNQDTRVVMDYDLTSVTSEGWASLFATRTANNTNAFALFAKEGFTQAYDQYASASAARSLSLNGRHRVDKNKNVTILDGTTVGTFTYTAFTGAAPMRLLWESSAGTTYRYPFIGKLYSCQIYDNGSEIRRYVPKQHPSGVAGLWDAINERFYASATVDDFSAGNPVGYVDITPTMTSNTTPDGYVVSASSQADSARQPWRAFDSIDSSASVISPVWHSAAGLPQWIMLQFPSKKEVTAFAIKNRADVDEYDQYGIVSFSLEGSNDGSEFVTLGTYVRSGAFSLNTVHKVENPSKYQYYRIKITAAGYVWSNQYYSVVDQIRFYEDESKVPDKPENFRTVTATDEQVTLGWDAVEEAEGYRLYQDGVLLSDQAENTFIAKIQPYRNYVFSVTAYNEYGEGESTSLVVFRSPENPMLWLITDRTQADVNRVKELAEKGWAEMTEEERSEWSNDMKGAYNASDLNRVGAAISYVANLFKNLGYSVEVDVKHNWLVLDAPTKSEMSLYLQNLSVVRSVVSAFPTTPQVPEDADGLNYIEANNIEQILLDLDLIIKNMMAAWCYSGELYAGEV